MNLMEIFGCVLLAVFVIWFCVYLEDKFSKKNTKTVFPQRDMRPWKQRMVQMDVDAAAKTSARRLEEARRGAEARPAVPVKVASPSPFFMASKQAAPPANLPIHNPIPAVGAGRPISSMKGGQALSRYVPPSAADSSR